MFAAITSEIAPTTHKPIEPGIDLTRLIPRMPESPRTGSTKPEATKVTPSHLRRVRRLRARISSSTCAAAAPTTSVTVYDHFNVNALKRDLLANEFEEMEHGFIWRGDALEAQAQALVD